MTAPLKRLASVAAIGVFAGGWAGAAHTGNDESLRAWLVVIGYMAVTAIGFAMAMVVVLAIEARGRRQLRPVVREPRCSHVIKRGASQSPFHHPINQPNRRTA